MHQNISGIASELSPNNPILKEVLLMIYRNNGKEQMDRFIAEYKADKRVYKTLRERIIEFMVNLPEKIQESVKSLKTTKIGNYLLMTWVDYQIKKKLKDDK